MRWAITCPDGIGDFLLRLPWLFAMERLGWETLIVARAPTIEVGKLSGLHARFYTLGLSPYSKPAKIHKDPFREERRAIVNFAPDFVFFGPCQPSMLEEELAGRLSGQRMGGFVLEDGFWPSESLSSPREIAERYDMKILFSRGDSEPEKNARAAAALGCGSGELEPFHFSKGCREALPRNPAHDFQDEGYLVVSPGYRAGDYFSGLGCDRWIRQLADVEAQSPIRFLFTGAASEAAANAEIFAGLRNSGRHMDLTGRLDSLADLLSVLEGSQGFIGKDTGTMHLAAALEKPVVAIFGGGHGRRFLPIGTKAVVLTVAVSCRGCDWRCHLSDPICVTDLKDGAVAEAWGAIQGLRPNEVRVVEQGPTPEAQKILIAEPGTGFPERVHQKRRAGLREERERALSPFLVRAWRRLVSLHKY